MRTQNAVALGALLICAVAFSGCRTTFDPPSASVLPASELRAIQTRTYDALNQKAALKAALDVLQDDGYIIDYGNTELGILHATKIGDVGAEQSFSTPDYFRPFQPQFQLGPARDEATVNVTDFGAKTKIRVSLQRFVPESTAQLGNGGYPIITSRSTLVVDAKTYQEFFAKLDRGIFLQKQGL